MKEVVILGAGYAGLSTLKALQKKAGDFHITLVDQNDYHYEATALHEVAAGTVPKEKITYPIKEVVNTKVTTFLQDRVVKINTDKQEVELENNTALKYDYLVVALGFRSETFGISGAEENALEMVNIESAVNINNHINAMLKKYKETQDKKYLKFVVCGAGFTGIELLGSLAEMKPKYAKVAGVKPEEIEIYCVEAATRLLPMFNEKLANFAIGKLEGLGVKLLTGKPIKGIKPETVVYQDNAETEELAELEAATIIWTTGVSGSFVMGESGFAERRGRVMVGEDLRDPDHENVYIIGDVSAVMDPESGRPFPTTAQIALKMGDFTAHNILRQLNNQATETFTFKSQGSVASIGNTIGLGQVGNTSVKGYPASFLKKIIMNKSLAATGGMKQMFAKGRFDLYH
ncbi:NAD(P)/FAD-dependent oxidoreductase [Vagococcus zengguangii]|uniref:NAD(P)/FAD-dependent oxidoreductase n=1 Tax=Vagococcus zengguangii TaxID=2571750 RepID=A0A4D7CS30_9ENTE|nr:NAD(P)/FAD-dependent oxidoreductase [Vagococcus zengguangii]QCI86929.1 NAD(P)/FAD-dependent oxidoreductase [Vagococcus zengguangii]TLG81029.1 NAD(P)/FAD-dependent oxidoreductase [Vagococcus zengguangii]